MEDGIRLGDVRHPVQFDLEFFRKSTQVNIFALWIFHDAQKGGDEDSPDAGTGRRAHFLRDSADDTDRSVRQDRAGHCEVVRQGATVQCREDRKAGYAPCARSVDIAGKLQRDGHAVHRVVAQHRGSDRRQPDAVADRLAAAAGGVVPDQDPQRLVIAGSRKFKREAGDMPVAAVRVNRQAGNLIFELPHFRRDDSR